MTAQARLSPPPAGGRAYAAYTPGRSPRPLDDPFDAAPAPPAIGARAAGFGDPAAPTIPSPRRLREHAAAAPHTPAAPPVTYAPAEPAELETRLRPPERPEHAELYVPLPGSPHPLHGLARRWACAFVPALEGMVALLLALKLALTFPALGDTLARDGGLPGLFAIYLLGGALYGLALYFAPRDGVWFASLLLGGALLPAAMLVALLGPLLGGAIGVALLALAGLSLRARGVRVGADTALITRLSGRPFRVLLPGPHLVLPFERIWAEVETGERTRTAPAQYVALESPSGVPYRARAALTATYEILPDEAYRIVPIRATWERDLQRLLTAMLREALADWGTHTLAAGAAPPRGMLAGAVLGEARTWAHARGIWLMRVRVHNIWLEPISLGAAPPRVAPAPGELDPVAPIEAAIAPPIAPPIEAAPALARPPSRQMASPPIGRDESRPYTGPSGAAMVGPASHPDPVEDEGTASADVLASAYEAVREGRITDPTTIREIARAFAHAAGRQAGDGPFPYDADTAARILWDYAAQVERQMAAPGVAADPRRGSETARRG